MEAPTLYEKLGGEPIMIAAVDAMYQRVLKDPTLAPFFEGVCMEALNLHQRMFLAHVLGGPGQSSPGDVREAHATHGIELRHFYAVSDHMLDALSSLGVDEEIIAEVITLLEPLSKEIVNTPG